MNKMFFNVIHRADGGTAELEALQFQQDTSHQLGLKTTILMSYSALQDSRMMEYIKQQLKEYGDELGLHFHSLLCDDYKKRFKTRCRHFYLLPFEMKKKIIDTMMEEFEAYFGFLSQSLGSYVLDAQTLNYIHEKFPQVNAAITNCFEEGIKMFEGCNHGWYLFSDGGPWGAYYPSHANALCPAGEMSESNGIVGLPHLNRDMLLAVNSRDDFFSSHPLNLSRAKINDGDECTYMYRFIDQWIEQARYNGYSYYNIFVSLPWVMPGSPFVETVEIARSLYYKNLAYLKKKTEEGSAVNVTMTEFAKWYKENKKVGPSEAVLWNDILCGTKRQMFWYMDSSMRITIDPYAGGSIVDLRPYAGRLVRNVSPEEENLSNGSYPFIINSENRGGAGGSIHSAKISARGKTAALYDRRTRGMVEKGEDGKVHFVTQPITFNLGGLSVTIVSKFTFGESGKVLIERKITELSEPNEVVEITEFHTGEWGTTVYPEDLRGMELLACNSSGEVQRQLTYAYSDRVFEVKDPGQMEARIPMVNTRVKLVPETRADFGRIDEGYLFRPFYTLELGKTLKEGESMKSWLIIEKL